MIIIYLNFGILFLFFLIGCGVNADEDQSGIILSNDFNVSKVFCSSTNNHPVYSSLSSMQKKHAIAYWKDFSNLKTRTFSISDDEKKWTRIYEDNNCKLTTTGNVISYNENLNFRETGEIYHKWEPEDCSFYNDNISQNIDRSFFSDSNNKKGKSIVEITLNDNSTYKFTSSLYDFSEYGCSSNDSFYQILDRR